jgi:3-deoxy-manno-octulosonate cytidylyltransferase (CMP-KDO synthetase)
MHSNKTIVIIPSRLGSTRLPKKPLIDIGGLPMVIRVYQQALKANLGKVVIAGCDEELENLVKSFGYNYVSTDPNLQSGTDRVFHGYEALGEKYDNIINLQGDMPHVNPNTIIAVDSILNTDDNVDIATAVTPMVDSDSVDDRNIVKAIMTHKNIALYFTRAPIKFNQNYKHIGIYGFKAKALSTFVSLPQSNLEKQESLEQLRALENGMKIKVAIVDDPNISIDVEQDVLTSRKYIETISRD